MGPWAMEYRQPLETTKDKEREIYSFYKGIMALRPLDFSPVRPFYKISDLQNIKPVMF